MAGKKVTLGRRSAVVTLLYWGLVIVGIVLFLIALIIGFVYLGRKDPIFAHWLYWWLITFHYVAFGANLIMLFGTVTLRGTGGLLNQAIILALLYLLALIFDIIAGIMYAILGFEACAGKGQDQVEAGICDNQQWVVWVLWILIIILIFHSAVGIIAAILDRFMRRSAAGGEGETASSVAFEDPEEGTQARFSQSSFKSGPAQVMYTAVPLASNGVMPSTHLSLPPPPPQIHPSQVNYGYVTKGD